MLERAGDDALHTRGGKRVCVRERARGASWAHGGGAGPIN